MNLIPVIDLKEGVVVSALQGKRNIYQPIKSTLSSSPSIEDILQGFLSIYPFKRFYIADINAITDSGNNQQLIDKLINQYSSIEFWLDNGKKIQQLSLSNDDKYISVIGSECQNTMDFYSEIEKIKQTILSLDFFPDTGYKGPIELMQDSTLWPDNIILMTLNSIGKNAGPEMNRLTGFCKKYPEKNFIAAGGIRHTNDLLCLHEIGIKQVLIASALHSGMINTEIIERMILLA
ncbi:MAG: hypothetical protein HFP81_10740 [Methylococcales symbiont of Hymedesmia sp. n. MRB-2018]|nr:MAG: hypothetical protein HFP81_10740 [Methylococcales symbiont of Hymedesmia sp. n. MRB-2018]